MIAGAITMVLVLSAKSGGIAESISLVIQKYPSHIPADKHPGWLLLGALIFMTSFGVWGLPQMVQKFYAIKK